jgi:FkbM family methyltransferase
MTSTIKNFARRHPRLFAALRTVKGDFDWRRQIFADWRDNVLGEQLHSGVTPYGFRMVVRNNSANRAMLDGVFEPEETASLLRYLPQTNVFVDVGANVGYYTCLALKHGKHVIAVEPQSQNLHCLYASLEANNWTDRAEVFPVGLGTQPGVSILYGASGASASLVRNWAKYDPRYRQTIPLSTLDIVLADRFPNRGVFIKIDVEGYEYQVLQGSSRSLDRVPRPIWLVEIFFDEYHPSGMNPSFRDTFEWFWKYGYEVRTANSEFTLVRPTDVEHWCRIGRCDSGTINYIFTHPTEVIAGKNEM